MDSNTISGRIVRGVLAVTLAAAAGFGLVACQTPVAPNPEPAVYEDSLVTQDRVQQAANRLREQYAGRPADRIEEAVERQAEILRQLREERPGAPADRLEEALVRASRAVAQSDDQRTGPAASMRRRGPVRFVCGDVSPRHTIRGAGAERIEWHVIAPRWRVAQHPLACPAAARAHAPKDPLSCRSPSS